MDKDWDPDHFPTSVRPIVKAVSLLVLTLAVICGFLYYSSDEIENPAAELKKMELEDNLLADDQAEF
jgi:hypothetical protein